MGSEPTTPGYLIHVYWSKSILCLGASANRATSVQYPSIKGILTLYSHAKVHQSHQIIDKILLSQNFSVCLVLGEKWVDGERGREISIVWYRRKEGGKLLVEDIFHPNPPKIILPNSHGWKLIVNLAVSIFLPIFLFLNGQYQTKALFLLLFSHLKR